MTKLSAQVAIVTQCAKRLPMQKPQRTALADAIFTLQKLDNLKTKFMRSAGQPGLDESVVDDLLDILGLEAEPVVKAYGDGKHAPVS